MAVEVEGSHVAKGYCWEDEGEYLSMGKSVRDLFGQGKVCSVLNMGECGEELTQA